MDIKEITEKFLNWEEVNQLYEIKVNNFSVYTFIRMEVYESLVFNSDINESLKKRHTKQVNKINYFKIIKSCVGFFRNQHILNRGNWYLTNTDNKVKIGNVFVDNFFDKIFKKDTSPESAILEFPNLINYHYNKIQNKKRTVKVGVLYLFEFFFKGRVEIFQLENSVTEISRLYSILYRDIFGKNIQKHIREEIKKRISSNLRRVNVYEKFIGYYKPKIIYMKSAYSPMNQIITAVCKNHNIDVIEVQHGHIYPYHIGYLLPKNREVVRNFFPSKIYLWSNYYKNILLKNNWENEKVLVKGDFTYNNEISREKYVINNIYNDITSKYKSIITIISQHTLCDEINKFLIDIDDLPKDTAVIIKLHPRHLLLQERKFNEVVKNNKNVILQKEGSIKSCFEISDLAIGVYSTAIIEAIEMNKTVHLINISLSYFFEDLIKSKTVQKSNSIYDSYKKQYNLVKNTKIDFREPFN